jgi:hypothetical protein
MSLSVRFGCRAAAVIAALILLAGCVGAQERWHSATSDQIGGKLVRTGGVVFGRVDTSRVFIERLDTLRADTCMECQDGYERVVWASGETVCLRKRVVERERWFSCDPPEPPVFDTLWDVAEMRSKIHPLEVDTVWRLIPEGFEKAEWLALWKVMHPAPVVYNRLLDSTDFDTLYLWKNAVKAFIVDDSLKGGGRF